MLGPDRFARVLSRLHQIGLSDQDLVRLLDRIRSTRQNLPVHRVFLIETAEYRVRSWWSCRAALDSMIHRPAFGEQLSGFLPDRALDDVCRVCSKAERVGTEVVGSLHLPHTIITARVQVLVPGLVRSWGYDPIVEVGQALGSTA